jgi:hypothetical protein
MTTTYLVNAKILIYYKVFQTTAFFVKKCKGDGHEAQREIQTLKKQLIYFVWLEWGTN